MFECNLDINIITNVRIMNIYNIYVQYSWIKFSYPKTTIFNNIQYQEILHKIVIKMKHNFKTTIYVKNLNFAIIQT